jgi:predicted cupin superfamily sugar epimerase
MRSRTDRIRFDFKLHEAAPGLFDILLHLYADGRFYSETAISTVNGAKAVEILSIAVRYLLEKGHQAHISELARPSELSLAA